ncbi:hypothetical protein FQR65_LT15990 [Abscondita terminalis]|nr:hypothetical protein FQR65_LT15990 [Abscondita terminalis]
MKCHYKVLEIENDVGDAEIKAAYRRLALKWHPDKNLDNVEHAKDQFQLVQQAYEILSDRQERAWYDKHRDQILHERDFQDTALDDFMRLYRHVFERISLEDVEHTDKEDFIEPPSFGYSTSDYNEVVRPFYSYWASYNTKRSYSWLNLHSMQEIRDRRIFKSVEKENRKIRLKAKKDRNEEVRALVAFVRKRDKRVHENSKRMEAKVLENRQKQEKICKQKRLQRHKELSNSKPLPDWITFDEVESQLKSIEISLIQQFGERLSEEEYDGLDLYCVACDKSFKSDNGLKNHESSKKHKQNVEILKSSILQEEQRDSVDDDTLQSNEKSSSEEDLDPKPKPNQKKKKPKNVIQIDEIHEENALDNTKLGASDEEIGNFEELNSKKQKRKLKGVSSKSANTQPDEEDDSSKLKIDTELGHNGKTRKSKNKDKIGDASQSEKNNHICATCNANFPSKNKLFDHLKKTQHGVYLQSTGGASSAQRSHNSKKNCKK